MAVINFSILPAGARNSGIFTVAALSEMFIYFYLTIFFSLGIDHTAAKAYSI
jgi:hypothetical protein